MAKLGHSIGARDCKCQEEKIKKILNTPRPITKKHVWSFVSLTGTIMHLCQTLQWLPCLHTICSRNTLLKQLGDEEQEVFRTLKNLLCNKPVLHLPNFEKKFIFRTDASKDGLGAVLLQEYNGEDIPVS